jgi:GTPase SAR1 family protein
MEEIHVALIGDQGVGKTSLILAAAKKPARGQEPTPVLPPTRLHLSWLTAEAFCICHDTSSDGIEDVMVVLRKCDVVLVCFAMNRPASMRSALSKWLPLSMKANKQLPIIFVGCKRDSSVMSDADNAVCSESCLAAIG